MARKGQFAGAARTRSKETLRSAQAGPSPSRPGEGAAARSTMTPLALIQGFLRSSHSAQHRQIIPFASFGADGAETGKKVKRTAPMGDQSFVIRARKGASFSLRSKENSRCRKVGRERFKTAPGSIAPCASGGYQRACTASAPMDRAIRIIRMPERTSECFR